MKLSLFACSAAIIAAVPTTSASVRQNPRAAAAKRALTPSIYDFKGARLGITIEQWKALPIPLFKPDVPAEELPEFYGFPAIGLCSDGPEKEDGRPVVSVDPNEKEIGIIKCQYFRKKSDETYYPADIQLGSGGTNYVKYSFFQGKMYKIEIVSDIHLFSSVREGLVAKWGAPSGHSKQSFQTRSGANFPGSIDLWINPLASITLTAPAGDIDGMAAMYTAAGPDQQVSKAIKTAHPAADMM